jgi:hypothetical protein
MNEWIVVPNWDKFQHYIDRDPVWIKVYTELNSRDDFLELTPSGRGLLLTIWLEYARSRGRLRAKTVLLLCGPHSRYAHLKPLVDAGYIQLSASPRALAREEVKREKNKQALTQKPRPVDNSDPGRSNVLPKDPASAVEAMIRNRVITDPVDLTAEIAGYHLDDKTAARLRGLLQ